MEEKIHIIRKKESDEVRLKGLKENMSKGLKPKMPTQKERWEMYQRRCKGESKTEE